VKDDRGTSATSPSRRRVRAKARATDEKTSRDRAPGAKKKRPLDDDEARHALAQSPKLYYRIGEVSELTAVKAHVLRYWETEFRWMAPPKSRSKQRLYRKRDIELIWLLKRLLWDQRYTIAGARQRIQELGLDEALARSADAESLDASALEGDAMKALASAPGEAADGSLMAANEQGDSSAIRPERDWTGFRIALESIQSELLDLRGALQQGL
jgi:DNA-binding transcriptional MerR regulator